MTMTVGELKDLLDGLDDDMEVRWAAQPSWAFEYSIASGEVVNANAPDPEELESLEEDLRVAREITEEPERSETIAQITDAIMEFQKDEEESENVLYLTEGSQLGYLPEAVARAIGWSKDSFR